MSVLGLVAWWSHQGYKKCICCRPRKRFPTVAERRWHMAGRRCDAHRLGERRTRRRRHADLRPRTVVQPFRPDRRTVARCRRPTRHGPLARTDRTLAVRAQYVLRLRRLRIGYECEFGCNYPDNDGIDWTEGPSRWCLTRAGAMRWARRRERWHGRLDVPMAREEILL